MSWKCLSTMPYCSLDMSEGKGEERIDIFGDGYNHTWIHGVGGVLELGFNSADSGVSVSATKGRSDIFPGKAFGGCSCFSHQHFAVVHVLVVGGYQQRCELGLSLGEVGGGDDDEGHVIVAKLRLEIIRILNWLKLIAEL